MPRSVESARSCSKPYVQCWLMRRWTWSLVIGTLLLGDAQRAPAHSASSKKPSSILTCPCLLTPHRCGVQGLCLVRWSDVCGFINPPDSNERWSVQQHGAFPIRHEALSIWQTDQSCHHGVWLQLDIVEWRSAQSHHERHDRRILLKERSTPYHYSKQKGDISEDVSDHSLSSC